MTVVTVMVMVAMAVATADRHPAHPGNPDKGAVIMVVVVVIVTPAPNDNRVVVMVVVLGELDTLLRRHLRTHSVIGLQLLDRVGNRCEQVAIGRGLKRLGWIRLGGGVRSANRGHGRRSTEQCSKFLVHSVPFRVVQS